MRYQGAHIAETLVELESAPNYANWIVRSVSSGVSGRILEVGAGSGNISVLLADLGSLTVVEPDPRLAARLSERVPSAHVIVSNIEQLLTGPAIGSFDSIVLVNVLEHIEDDAAALQGLRGLLRPGGTLCLWVPAFPLLMSPYDRLIGHHRRYRRGSLRSLVERAGFVVERSRYRNHLGWFVWLLLVRLARRNPAQGGLVRVFDRWFVPVLERVETALPPPFGQSLVVVARTAEESPA